MKMARMEVGVDLLDESEVSGACVVVEILNVEREAVITGKGGEETQDLLPDHGALAQDP